jgi:hypothetical protein
VELANALSEKVSLQQALVASASEGHPPKLGGSFLRLQA